MRRTTGSDPAGADGGEIRGDEERLSLSVIAASTTVAPGDVIEVTATLAPTDPGPAEAERMESDQRSGLMVLVGWE